VNGSAAPESRLQLDCHGVVQGVGARPALRRLADRLGLRGQLRNRLGVLQLDLCGATNALERLLAALPEALPAAARLERLDARWLKAPVPPWPEGVLIAADPARRFPSAEDADLVKEGAASFHRQLIVGGLASEYDNEIRAWLELLE
jgi:acylphosphatase